MTVLLDTDNLVALGVLHALILKRKKILHLTWFHDGEKHNTLTACVPPVVIKITVLLKLT